MVHQSSIDDFFTTCGNFDNLTVFVFYFSHCSGHTMNDADLANIRNQTNVYIQQIEALQAQIPTEIQKVSR